MAAISAYPVALTLDLLAPVRAAKRAVAPPSPGIARPTSKQLTKAMQIVESTAWLEVIEPLMPHAMRKARGTHPGGRTPEMPLRALFVALLLLAMMERPLLIRDAHRLLAFGLDTGSRKRLGLDPKKRVTERMVSRAFSLLAATLSSGVHSESNAALFDADNVKELMGLGKDQKLTDYEHAYFIQRVLGENEKRLELFIRAGLRATHPENSGHEGDYNLDGTYVWSWERYKSTRRKIYSVDKNGVKKRRPVRANEKSDPDATWWAKKNDGPVSSKGSSASRSNAGLGYLVTAVTWAEKDCGPGQRGADIPNLIEHLTVKTANTNGQLEGGNVLESMVGHHEVEDEAAGKPDRVRGDILADREYTRVSDWQKRMHIIGLTPHFNLASEQRGHTHTLGSGVLIIDGIPYSPGIPTSLRIAVEPPVFATREDRAFDAAFFLQRKPFRLRVNGGRRQNDGSLNLYCPASNQAKAAISCSNKPSSLKGNINRIQIGTALPVIVNQPSPLICSQTTATISFDEAPFWQPHIPGTPEHQWSFHRRNLVESAFSRIKDEATNSLRRGTFRVMGRAKVSLAVLFNAMAANLAEVERWDARKNGLYLVSSLGERQKRIPRRHTRARIEGAARRQNAQVARAAAALLVESGMVIDLRTGEILTKGDPAPTE